MVAYEKGWLPEGRRADAHHRDQKVSFPLDVIRLSLSLSLILFRLLFVFCSSSLFPAPRFASLSRSKPARSLARGLAHFARDFTQNFETLWWHYTARSIGRRNENCRSIFVTRTNSQMTASPIVQWALSAFLGKYGDVLKKILFIRTNLYERV